MAKRGRPRKENLTAQVKEQPGVQTPPRNKGGLGGVVYPAPIKKPKSPKLSKLTDSQHWQQAQKQAAHISDHYSMLPEEQQLAFFATLAMPKKAVILELGVTHGKTAALLSYACQVVGARYFGIDNYKTEGTLETTTANLESAGINHVATLIKGNCHEVPWKKPIDLLLFDAGHDFLNMRRDIERFLPFIKPGGIALFHAYNPKADYTDPHYPVKHFSDLHTKSWEELAYIPNILIKRKPSR
jgi:predicted O-methyltransferase YrrM